MTLNQWLQHLGWNVSDLVRYAEINRETARKVVSENITSARTARKIADAISKASGQTVFPGDIEGLVIQN